MDLPSAGTTPITPRQPTTPRQPATAARKSSSSSSSSATRTARTAARHQRRTDRLSPRRRADQRVPVAYHAVRGGWSAVKQAKQDGAAGAASAGRGSDGVGAADGGTSQPAEAAKAAPPTRPRRLDKALAALSAAMAQQVLANGLVEAANTCWVGGIPSHTTEDTLRSVFGAFGTVASVSMRQKDGDLKSWALVAYDNAFAASLACEARGGVSVPGSDGVREQEDDVAAVVLRVEPADIDGQAGREGSTGGLVTTTSNLQGHLRAARTAVPPPAEPLLAATTRSSPAERSVAADADSTEEAEAAVRWGGEAEGEPGGAAPPRPPAEPSYANMLLTRAAVFNSMGQTSSALEDLTQLVEMAEAGEAPQPTPHPSPAAAASTTPVVAAAEGAAGASVYRALSRTQRCLHLTRNRHSDQPGGLVPSTETLDKAVCRRPADMQLTQEYRASVQDVARGRPYWGLVRY
jgi:hypothetical protein